MVIVDTFAVIDQALYAVKFEGEGEDELDRTFNQWNDPLQLHDFFSNHIDDLNSGFFGTVSIQDAVRITREEAKVLQKELYRLAKEGLSGSAGNLSQLFKPLTKGEIGSAYERDKAYGLNHKSWLRLYAIRINVNVFVICGSAIKLTETMNDREHLMTELKKLEIARNYLITDDTHSDFFYELSL
ncbi:MAG: hypothetical protein ABJG41_16385 [Cyclobacteriaceae bacterium]